ncbi:transposase family protein [Streptomyces sp. NPDC058052]|uniref:transposase family protein n=1 Tax=Streptomyces sp. NPDC058052 TaxID=3346316 RepID=UPI0036E9D254
MAASRSSTAYTAQRVAEAASPAPDGPCHTELLQSGQQSGDGLTCRDARGSCASERGVRRLNSPAQKSRWFPILPHSTYHGSHGSHGVSVQVITDPVGKLLWISPALSGRTHDPTGARTHRTIRICERQDVPSSPTRTYIGAGPWVTTPIRRLPGRTSPRPSRGSTELCQRRGHRSNEASQG